MIDIEEIRARNEKSKQYDEDGSPVGEWRPDQAISDNDALLAEVGRNRCRACGHAFVDHNLYQGTSYLTCHCGAECYHAERINAPVEEKERG